MHFTLHLVSEVHEPYDNARSSVELGGGEGMDGMAGLSVVHVNRQS